MLYLEWGRGDITEALASIADGHDWETGWGYL